VLHYLKRGDVEVQQVIEIPMNGTKWIIFNIDSLYYYEISFKVISPENTKINFSRSHYDYFLTDLHINREDYYGYSDYKTIVLGDIVNGDLTFELSFINDKNETLFIEINQINLGLNNSFLCCGYILIIVIILSNVTGYWFIINWRQMKFQNRK